MTRTYDVAIAGAGIIGLAHAYQAARRGLRVAVHAERLHASRAAAIDRAKGG